MASSEGEESVKLLNVWPSMFGLRVHYALDLKGVKYEYSEQDLRNKGEELVQANPVYKKIPVLIHNGKPVCESTIIVEYIDSVWPQHKLLPDDPYERAVARFWADFGDKLYEALVNIMKKQGQEQAEAVEALKDELKTLDGAVSKVGKGKPFFGGEKMNFADVCVAPFICWWEAFEKMVAQPGVIPSAEECPSLHQWMSACSQQDAVKKSTPEPGKLLDFILVYRQRFVAGAN